MNPRRPRTDRPSRPAATGRRPGAPPAELTLDIERPVAGGRMLARHDGQVVLVAGAIPGERVRARLTRQQKGVWFADVAEVLRPSDARRDPGPDPGCGGMTYAHITPDRQHRLKAEVVVDAFQRIARLPIALPLVHAGAERGYRMRVRLHVRDGRLGSFREGTHEVCDVAASGQVLDETLAVIEALAGCLRAHGVTRIEALEIAENLDATARVVHVEQARGETLPAAVLSAFAGCAGVTGVSCAEAWSPRLTAVSGVPWVEDPLSAFTGLDAASTGSGATPARVRRHARSFFQANRFLTPTLVQRVLARIDGGPVVDLYAGVGLFALSALGAGHDGVVAVEGDSVSATDLDANASAFGSSVRAVHEPVESFLGRMGRQPDATLIVDPPRTGISREAMDGVLASGARRIVYVSCDVATLARDARRLVDAGYRMGEVEAFDLFPNTGHVEVLTSFDRVSHEASRSES